MNTYRVLVTRNATETAIIRVTAPTVEEAEEKALELAREYPQHYEFRVDEGNESEYYLGDPGSAEEV